MALTGNKDVDKMIMMKLDDENLLNLCMTNKKSAQVCNDDMFWKNRFFQEFPKPIEKGDLSWKQLYLKTMYYLGPYLKTPWDIFSEVNYKFRIAKPRLYLGGYGAYARKNNIKIATSYNMLNLGNKLRLGFPLDLGATEPVIMEYNTDTYFTPKDVMNITYTFYNSPLTVQEYDERIEDAGYDVSRRKVERGTVKRKNLVRGLKFGGFTYNERTKAYEIYLNDDEEY